jgi:rubredoxin
LAGLSVEDQELWLDRAEAGAMSVRSLRSELRHARQRAASRVALAEARGRRDEAVTSIRSNGAAFAAEFEAPDVATSSQCNGGTSTAVPHEVVCPECGCHFAPVTPVTSFR